MMKKFHVMQIQKYLIFDWPREVLSMWIEKAKFCNGVEDADIK